MTEVERAWLPYFATVDVVATVGTDADAAQVAELVAAGLVSRDDDGWRITDAGRALLES